MLNNTDFMRWDDAYESCESADIDTWFQTQIMGTPNSRDKYGTLLEIFAKKNGVDSLAVLQEVAIKSAENEYFDTIIMQMNNAVQPGLGETMSDASRTAFENAILAIAAKAPSKALILAQQLKLSKLYSFW